MRGRSKQQAEASGSSHPPHPPTQRGRHGGVAPPGSSNIERKPRRSSLHPVFCTLEELYTGCTKACEVPGTQQQLLVKVPAGARHGSIIEAGDQSDIAFSVVEPLHPVFRREGDDLVVVRELSLEEAVCGTTLQVRHLDGELLELEVPAMRLVADGGLPHTFWGRGMPRSSMPGACGDLQLRVSFRPPARVPRWQQDAIRSALPGGVLKAGPPPALMVLHVAARWVVQQVRLWRHMWHNWLRDG